jgi:ankyrin repeat protein
MSISSAAFGGDLAEVQRLVGEDPGLLNARNLGLGRTPLFFASMNDHVEVVRWLADRGATIDERDELGWAVLSFPCRDGHLSVVKLLLERGADRTFVDKNGATLLMTASEMGRLEVVRLLLEHPSARATINRGDCYSRTALWFACHNVHGGAARALLENGADPTISDGSGTTPMAIAKLKSGSPYVSADGLRDCIAALEVRVYPASPAPLQHLS